MNSTDNESSPSADEFDLARFVIAQENVYARVWAELRSGTKRGHWMWFIFPQVRGLGHSETAQRFGISSRAEALAYLNHPLLGARLRECAELVVQIGARDISRVFGFPDDMKLKSSMTLFADVAHDGEPFRRVLDLYFDGTYDAATLELLEASAT